MFNITLPVADAVFTGSNVVLVLGAVLALLGTAGVFWSGGIRERFADERVAANEAQTAQANAEAAKANAEAAQARLEQERLKLQMAWRRVAVEQAQVIAHVLQGHSFNVMVSCVGSDAESVFFRQDIDAALRAAGLSVMGFTGYQHAAGLTLRGGSQEQRGLLLQAFRAANLPMVPTDEPGLHPDHLEVLVGSKPPPDFQQAHILVATPSK